MAKAKAKFKKGDEVKIVHKCTASSKKHNGQTGIITKVIYSPRNDSKETKVTGDYYYIVSNDKRKDIDCWETDLVLLGDQHKVITGIIRNKMDEKRGFETKDSGEREEFASGMVRDTQEDKPLYTLIPTFMMKRWAELMMRGAVKYGRDNWKKASGEEEKQRFKDSAYRHFIQWLNGEKDEDHAAAVFFNIAGAEHVDERIERDN